ncbi:MAG TPA: O-methyltransferase [Acidimicrobiales bacterium]|nr:O-methyltransferase [Acidimicrobiales bacterium]
MTDPALWAAVDAYIVEALLPPDPVLDGALAASTAAGLPAINVAPNQGRLLEVLVRLQGARTILEVGTLGGYSTIWMARALPPGGRLVSLELDPARAEVARRNLEAAGLAGVAEVRAGPALAALAELEAAGEGPFDFVFIDADKRHNADYVDAALRLSVPGTVVVVDNVVRAGQVIDDASDDPDVVGTRRLFERLGSHPNLCATAVQTVGSKGHDGLAIAVVT